jgi:AcrR family transcriptional regulator
MANSTNRFNRRKIIIKTAEQLIIDEGYENMSVDQIMRNVGIDRSTFYHYFSSKKDVLEAVIEANNSEIQKFIDGFIDNDSVSAVDKFYKIFKYYIDITWKKEKLWVSLWMEENYYVRYRFNQLQMKFLFPAHLRIIEQGIDENVFSTDSPFAATISLLGSTYYSPREYLEGYTFKTTENYIIHMINNLERILDTPQGLLIEGAISCGIVERIEGSGEIQYLSKGLEV